MDSLAPMTVMPRDKLRAAHAAQNEAQAILEKAVAAATRANKHLEKAEAHLATFENLDALAAQHRVDRLKAWAENGGHPPDDEAEPVELQTAREKRRHVEMQAKDARVAHEALQGVVEKALVAVRDASATVHDAAMALVRDKAVELARLLDGAEALRWKLRYQLEGLGGAWVTRPGDSPKPIALPAAAREALDPRARQYAGRGSFVGDETARWQAVIAALIADPDAEI